MAGAKHKRAIVGLSLKVTNNHSAVLFVQRGGWLVTNNDARLYCQNAGESYALALAAG